MIIYADAFDGLWYGSHYRAVTIRYGSSCIVVTFNDETFFKKSLDLRRIFKTYLTDFRSQSFQCTLFFDEVAIDLVCQQGSGGALLLTDLFYQVFLQFIADVIGKSPYADNKNSQGECGYSRFDGTNLEEIRTQAV